MEEKLYELPKGWTLARLGEIAVYINGRAFKPSEWEKEGLPIIRIQNLNDESAPFNYTTKKFEDIFHVINGDLLFAWSASLGVFIWKRGDAWLNQHIFKVLPYKSIEKKFLYFSLKKIIADLYMETHGSGMVHITKGKFEQSLIMLPPYREQKRIVEKIEELFSRLDAGIESLKKVQTQIKRYRQAVLKHAFEGKLTAAWREANKQRLKPASTLLERIKEGKKQKKSGKQKELTSLDTSSLHSIPVMWKWAKVGEVCYLMQYGTSEKASKSNTGYPILRMGNIQNGSILFDDLKYMPKEWKKSNDFILQRGDILFNRTNSAELVGKSAVFKNYHLPVVFASYLIRVRTKIDPFYVSNYINSYYGRLYIASVVSQQVGQANVSATKLSSMSIPLPPLEEQQKIVEEIERRFSIADRIEEIVDQNLKKAERLRQSILKKAFEGKLVPQDPTDEPASVLLERIKAEKEKNASNKKQCRRSKK